METEKIRNLTHVIDGIENDKDDAEKMLDCFDENAISIKISSRYGRDLTLVFDEGYAELKPIVKKILQYVSETNDTRKMLLKDMILKEVKK